MFDCAVSSFGSAVRDPLVEVGEELFLPRRNGGGETHQLRDGVIGDEAKPPDQHAVRVRPRDRCRVDLGEVLAGRPGPQEIAFEGATGISDHGSVDTCPASFSEPGRAAEEVVSGLPSRVGFTATV